MNDPNKIYKAEVRLRPCLYGEKLARGPGAPSSPSQLYSASTWKKCEPGYDKLPLSTDWNISVRMLCVAWLDPAGRVDSLETVYMRKSWLAPQGHPVLPTEWPYPQGHPTPPEPGLQFYKQIVGKLVLPWLVQGGRVPWVPGPTFLHINRALELGWYQSNKEIIWLYVRKAGEKSSLHNDNIVHMVYVSFLN